MYIFRKPCCLNFRRWSIRHMSIINQGTICHLCSQKRHQEAISFVNSLCWTLHFLLFSKSCLVDFNDKNSHATQNDFSRLLFYPNPIKRLGLPSQWLGDYFLFGKAYFQVLCYSSGSSGSVYLAYFCPELSQCSKSSEANLSSKARLSRGRIRNIDPKYQLLLGSMSSMLVFSWVYLKFVNQQLADICWHYIKLITY